MALQWSQLRDQSRRLLQDYLKPNPRWTDLQMLDYVCWSLDSLCSHTAIATATSFTGDGIQTAFAIPDNLYESLERSGAVYVDDGTTISYLNLIPLYKRATALNGYYINGNFINTILTPSNNSTISLFYFAYYPHPTNDSDLILAPGWAQAALAYRIAAYAHSSLSGKTAQIRQWGTKPDTGNPVDNPLMDQSEYFFKLYEAELFKVPYQPRENYWRSTMVNGWPKVTT